MELVQSPDRISYHRLSNSDTINLFKDSQSYPYIALDTESNGRDIRDGRGVCYGISISTELPSLFYVSNYISVGHPNNGGYRSTNIDRDTFLELKEVIEHYSGVLVFHNAKYDLESLHSIGIDYNGTFVDTMLWAHLINENLPYSKTLDACGKYYLKDAGKKYDDQFKLFLSLYGWEGMPEPVIREYAEYDAVLTYSLFKHLYFLIKKEELEEYWYNHKSKFLNVIRAMERRGVIIDVPACKRMQVHGEYIMQDVKDILGLNPGSGKDLEELLINRLMLPVVKRSIKTGKASFDKEAMEVYDRILELKKDETAEFILTYRGWQKAVSSNYIPYMELLSPDGRLRPNYKLHGTKTGRMSCEKPNLQQIPREGNKPWNGDMKSTFLAEEGWTLWEFDYAQLELRLASAYAREETLLKAFEDNRDVFTEMADELGFTRQDTKTLTYTIQYGGGAKRVKEVFGVSEERAKEIIDSYYERYPGFRQVSNLAKNKVFRAGKVKLWSGRYRHFRWPKEENHKAFNSVIQGGAADIVESAMINLYEHVDNEQECRMLLTVHDSVIFEIKNGCEEKYLPKIKDIMENVSAPNGETFGVKFSVDAHIFGEK